MTSNDQVTIDPPPTGSGAIDGRRGVRRVVVASDELVVKQGSGRERARLRHEADLLRRLAGARVVDVVEVREHDDLTELVLADAGHRSLADLDLGTTELTLRAVQRLAEAVADLHDRGWSHGAICAEHAVVNQRGNVRLCSLGSARPADAGAGDVDADLSALLATIEHVARSTGSQRLGVRDGFEGARTRRRLEQLVERSGQRLDRGELTAAAVAHDVRELRRGVAVGGMRRVGALRPRTLVLCAAGLAATVLVVSTALASPTDPPTTASPTATAPAASTATTLAPVTSEPSASRPPTPATPAPTTAAPATPAPATPAEPLAADGNTSCAGPVVDIDGDGCDDTVLLDGEVVEVGGTRYALGIPGDTAVVGDWDCDGLATARVLRATSGEVFEFDVWATADADAIGRLVGAVDGAVGIVRGDDPTEIGCDVLHVVAADGSEEEL